MYYEAPTLSDFSGLGSLGVTTRKDDCEGWWARIEKNKRLLIEDPKRKSKYNKNLKTLTKSYDKCMQLRATQTGTPYVPGLPPAPPPLDPAAPQPLPPAAQITPGFPTIPGLSPEVNAAIQDQAKVWSPIIKGWIPGMQQQPQVVAPPVEEGFKLDNRILYGIGGVVALGVLFLLFSKRGGGSAPSIEAQVAAAQKSFESKKRR